MGRHVLEGTSRRSRRMLVGMPLATALATVGSNAMLGGIVMTAEEFVMPGGAPASAAPAQTPPVRTIDLPDQPGAPAEATAPAPRAAGDDARSVATTAAPSPAASPSAGSSAPAAPVARPAQRTTPSAQDASTSRSPSESARAGSVESEMSSSGPSASTSRDTASGFQTLRAESFDRHHEDDDDSDEGDEPAVQTSVAGISVLSFG